MAKKPTKFDYAPLSKKMPTSFNLSLYVQDKIARLAYHSGINSKSEVVEQILQQYFEGKDYPPLPDNYKV